MEKTFLKESNGTTPGGGYYVQYKDSYNGVKFKTVSEAHGYGMMLLAYMAGYDADAKKLFDGMYNMYSHHRSTINDNLMSWIISEDEDASKDDDAATDGDMDIAYALLLADNQWGSNGEINYREEAIRIIQKGLKGGEISTNSYRTLLGDWDDDKYSTRTSDWMPDHFRVYAEFTGDNFWLDIVDTTYSILNQIVSNYSPNTGLLPDFVVNKTPKPAQPNYLEDVTDGSYGYNACRDPWRLTTDYAIFKATKAKDAVTKMLDFIIDKTSGNPDNIMAGYELDGTVTEGIDYNDGAFTAPLVCAGIIDAKYQDWLNSGFDLIKTDKSSGYFGNTLTLLSMLVITGNWWAPTSSLEIVNFDKTDKGGNLAIYPNPFNPTTTISFNSYTKGNKLTIYDVSGRLLFSKMYNNIGKHYVVFNGEKYSSGVYFVKLIDANSVFSKKMILLK